MIDKEVFEMSIDRKLKRNISDSEDEDFSPQIPGKKKKICLDSGSESESGYVDKNIERNGEESEATSDEDEPLKKKTENSKVDTSVSTSDDEMLAVKNKCSSIYSNGSKTSGVAANEVSKEDTSDDDDDKPISKMAKRTPKLKNKSKVMENSDSSEDEPLVKKSSKSSENSNRSITKALDSDSDDEPLATFNKGKISPKATSTNLKMKYSSDSSEDEPLANKCRKSSVSSNDQSITKDLHSESENEFVATSNKGKISQTATSAKLEAVDNSANDSEDDFLTVKNKSSKKKSNESKNKNQSVSNRRIKTSFDEDEPIGKIGKRSKDKGKMQKKHLSSGSSDDEPLATKVTANKKQKSQETSDLSSDDEEKPLSSVSKISKQKVKKEVGKKHHSSSSSDDDEPLATKITTNKKQKSQDSSDQSSDDEEKPLSSVSKISKEKDKKVGKKHHSSSSSDDEPLATKNTANKRQKSQDSSDLSSDDEEKPLSSVSKTSKQKVSKKVSKDKTPPNGKIEHLKKYLRVAGIHVQSYDKLFENCKSIKSKVEKLLGLLHEKGLKGRPTIEKCKKLKKKIETKKEIAELDISNIIKSEGRPKRGLNGRTEKLLNTENSPDKKKFMRLRDIIDSEESD